MGLGLLGNFMGGAVIGASGEGLRQNQEAMKAEAQEKQRKQAFYDQTELVRITNQLGWARDKDMARINFKNNLALDAARFEHDDKKQGADHDFQASQQAARFVFEGDQKNKDRALEGQRVSLLKAAQAKASKEQEMWDLRKAAAAGDQKAKAMLDSLMAQETPDKAFKIHTSNDGVITRYNERTGEVEYANAGPLSKEDAVFRPIGNGRVAPAGKQPKPNGVPNPYLPR